MQTSNKDSQQSIVITGANGFIGSRLCEVFADQNWNVYAGVRNPNSSRLKNREDVHLFQWNVPKAMNWPDDKVDVCLHLAYAMTANEKSEAVSINYKGTRTAYRNAMNSGCEYQVFISSCSAHQNAQSFYGKSKYRLEQKFDIKRHLVLRPGFVVGAGGLFERMVRTVNSAPLLPVFDRGEQLLQIIHLEDLCRIIFELVTDKTSGLEVLAHPRALKFKNFQSMLMEKKKASLNLPSTPILWMTQSAEMIGMKLPVTSENLRGLRGMIQQKVSKDLLTRSDIMEPEDAVERALIELRPGSKA